MDIGKEVKRTVEPAPIKAPVFPVIPVKEDVPVEPILVPVRR